MNETRYIIEEIETGRFVSWVTESTGKVYYCKKPGTANYFLEVRHANNWMGRNGLHHSKFRIRVIESIPAPKLHDTAPEKYVPKKDYWNDENFAS